MNQEPRACARKARTAIPANAPADVG